MLDNGLFLNQRDRLCSCLGFSHIEMIELCLLTISVLSTFHAPFLVPVPACCLVFQKVLTTYENRFDQEFGYITKKNIALNSLIGAFFGLTQQYTDTGGKKRI